MSDLPSILAEPIQTLLEDGDKLFEKGRIEVALGKYREAEALLPSDRQQYEATTWVLTAIGDALFALEHWQHAFETLNAARACPEGEDNPFILLRLGQAALELGLIDIAKAALAEALNLAGEEIFEDEAPKYRALLD